MTESSAPSLAAPAAAPVLPPASVTSRRRWGRALVWLSLALLFVPPFLFSDDAFRLSLYAKYLALAILALGVDLVWGYTGMLSLGQGLYFSLGAYALAYSLELQQVAVDAHAPPGTVP